MKRLAYLFAVLLLCATFGTAKADDFAFRVQDPGTSDMPLQVTSTAPFIITFNPCVFGEQFPSGTTANGCFYAANRTGGIITTLEAAFDRTAPLALQTAFCDTTGPTNFDPHDSAFANATCTLNTATNQFNLVLSGGPGIGPGFFTILEAGADPSAFTNPNNPNDGLTKITFANATVTPEPESVVLLSSGVAFVSSLVYKRRRGIIGQPGR